MHIGKRIQEVMKEKHCSAIQMAAALGCDRSNVYNLFSRASVDTALLAKVGHVLRHNFFRELAAEF